MAVEHRILSFSLELSGSGYLNQVMHRRNRKMHPIFNMYLQSIPTLHRVDRNDMAGGILPSKKQQRIAAATTVKSSQLQKWA